MKRAFDIAVSLIGLMALLPFLPLLAMLIKLESPGPIFFRQERIGKGFRPFFIYKFRTMIEDASTKARSITAGDDPRITRVGHLLRQTKIDELPQLFNVLKGEMKLVGPRPEVPKYVKLFRKDFEEILQVRPGITDLASVKYRDEATILGRAKDPEEEYLQRVLPEKIALAKTYIQNASFLFDLKLVANTVVKIFRFSEAQ
jgi:lipopolysaccharide/colanic/teichoic acid biosynthesis glycosyltransferase